MLLDIEQDEKTVKLSYFDLEGNVSYKRYEPKDIFAWEVCSESDKNKDTFYRNWDNRPVKKVYQRNFSKMGITEFIEKLSPKDQEDIFSYNMPKKYFVDIEVEVTDGFPEAYRADNPVTLITIITPNKQAIVLATRDLDQSEQNKIQENLNGYVKKVNEHFDFKFKCFKSEYDLLYTYFTMMKKFPIVSGWNFLNFDWTYLTNRAKKLHIDISIASPSNKLSYDGMPLHVGIIDYMNLYDEWDKSVEIKENVQLDTAAQEVVGLSKIKYDGSLQELYEKDYPKYVYYGIVDSILVYLIDKKLRTLDIMLTMSKICKVSLYKASSPVNIAESLLLREYLKEHKVVAREKNKSTSVDERKYPGAFVKTPLIGLHKAVALNDYASLYPSTMRQHNMSPESYLGRINPKYDKLNPFIKETLEKFYTKEHVIPSAREKEFLESIKDIDYSVTVNGAVFSKKESALKRILDDLYSQRKEYKAESKKYQIELDKLESAYKKNKTQDLKEQIEECRFQKDKYYNMEQSIKLTLNSIYGAFGNRYFFWFNIDIATAITQQGADAILHSEDMLNKYFKDFWHQDKELHKKLNVEVTGKITKPVGIYIDTDSLFIEFGNVIKTTNTTQSVVDFIQDIYKYRLNDYITKFLNKYAAERNCTSYLDFELESIAYAAIWLSKKKYMQNMAWKDPGISYESLTNIKSKGVEIIQSSTPLFARKKLKDLITYVFSLDDVEISGIVKKIKDIKKEFKISNIEHLTINFRANNLKKYIVNDYDKFEVALKCPMQVRAAGYHNYLLNNSKVKNKYQKLKDGEKIKMYISKDKNCDVFAFTSGNYPIEIAPQMDYDSQFERVIINPINRVLNAIGLQALDKNLIYSTAVF